MGKIEERKQELANNGIDTRKYFSFIVPETIKAGSKLTIRIDEDMDIVSAEAYANMTDNIRCAMDELAAKIKGTGYVGNNHLFRRWVMAQMFRMLNYSGGYNEYLNNFYDYKYQFEMMRNEIKVLARMEKDGGKDFEIRSSFFTKNTVLDVCADYYERLDKYCHGRPRKNCRGQAYVTVGGRHVFITDLDEKVFVPVAKAITAMYNTETYKDLLAAYDKFMKVMIKLPHDTSKSSVWKSTFKGEGAYYTLQNLIRFHGVRIDGNNLKVSEEILEAKRKEYAGEGYKLFAMMKDVIDYNNFDFNTRMKEIYGE